MQHNIMTTYYDMICYTMISYDVMQYKTSRRDAQRARARRGRERLLLMVIRMIRSNKHDNNNNYDNIIYIYI